MYVCTHHLSWIGGGWKRTKIKFQEPIESNPKFLSQSVTEVCVCVCVCVCDDPSSSSTGKAEVSIEPGVWNPQH
jgi:hypothetical protein